MNFVLSYAHKASKAAMLTQDQAIEALNKYTKQVQGELGCEIFVDLKADKQKNNRSRIKIKGFNYTTYQLVLVAHGHRAELALGISQDQIEKGDLDQRPDVSHLCHNPWCIKYEHLFIEPSVINRNRNVCKGPDVYIHVPRCLSITMKLK